MNTTVTLGLYASTDCSPLNVNFACVTADRLRRQLDSPVKDFDSVAKFVQSWTKEALITIDDLMPATRLADNPADRGAVASFLLT